MKNRIFIMLVAVSLAGVAQAGEVSVDQWFNYMVQGQIGTIDQLHAEKRLDMKNFPKLIDRAVKEFGALCDLGTKTAKAEAKTLIQSFLLFYNDFALQKHPELNQEFDQNTHFPKVDVVRLFLERAGKYFQPFVKTQKEISDKIMEDLELESKDGRKRLRKVADVVRGDWSQKKPNSVLVSSQTAPVSKTTPIKCTVLAGLILKGDVSDAIVELALKMAGDINTCSVDGKLVPTPVLLMKAKRFALLKKTFVGVNELSNDIVKNVASEYVAGRVTSEDFQTIVGAERAKTYAEQRFNELLESIDDQEQAELEFWSLSGFINFF